MSMSLQIFSKHIPQELRIWQTKLLNFFSTQDATPIFSQIVTPSGFEYKQKTIF
jgi:hypothetical protein